MATKYEIGTDKLFQNPRLWDALRLMVVEELANYHSIEDPIMSEDEEEFAYEGILPAVKQVLREHFNKAEYPECIKPLTDMSREICKFAERVVSDISDINHIKCLSAVVVELKKTVGISPEIISRLSSRFSVKQAGIADSAIKARYELDPSCSTRD